VKIVLDISDKTLQKIYNRKLTDEEQDKLLNHLEPKVKNYLNNQLLDLQWNQKWFDRISTKFFQPAKPIEIKTPEELMERKYER